jgi:hypothetical protein
VGIAWSSLGRWSVLGMKSRAPGLGGRASLETLVDGEVEGVIPAPGLGVFPSSVNPECPWLRPRQQGGRARRRKHKSRSNAFSKEKL